MVEKVANKQEKMSDESLHETTKQGNDYSAGTNTFTTKGKKREKEREKEKSDFIRSLRKDGLLFLHDRDLSGTSVLYRPINSRLLPSVSRINGTSGCTCYAKMYSLSFLEWNSNRKVERQPNHSRATTRLHRAHSFRLWKSPAEYFHSKSTSEHKVPRLTSYIHPR